MIFFRGRSGPAARFLCVTLLLLSSSILHAGVIRGWVTDVTGAPVKGASIVLLNGTKYVSTTISAADGNYQFTTGQAGRFSLAITAASFRQLNLPTFYAGAGDNVEKNLVLEPEWVHQGIVVTATGTPTPQQQTSEATDILTSLDVAYRADTVSLLRLMPGTVSVQSGQLGAQSSLFVRGGASDSNKVLLDGVSVGDLGGRFDFGNLATTGIDSIEVYRGPNSSLYGADAGSGVVAFTTPHGVASFPMLTLTGDVGNFHTSREAAEVAGAHKKIDYYSAYSWLQTQNALPKDPFHVSTEAGNFGWQPLASTQLRGTVHYGVDATGAPGAWNFYKVAEDATQKDQDLFLSASLDNQTTADFHNSLRYGLTRKREQYSLWQPSGQLIQYATDPTYGPLYAYFGDSVTVKGANGYVVSGRAMLDYLQTYPYRSDLVSNRDQVSYQGDYRITPHVTALIGFHYEDERGVENIPTYATYESVERRNYDYLASVHGDYKGRFFYTLGGSLEHYSLFGVQTTPRAGFSLYAIKPRAGIFSGTRFLFNYADGVREPALTTQFGSLYQFLSANGYQPVAQQLHISPLSAPATRTYEGGLEQAFLSDRLIMRATYFHNQFGRQIESVGGRLLPELLPGLSDSQKQQLISALGFYYANDYGLYVNSEAYRAQGVETTIEGGISSHLFLRGGYTYLDSVVQRSFNSDNEALAGGYEPTYNGIPIGVYSPLKGARPFRLPPHTGFASGTFTSKRITLLLSGAFASRSDDSTFLAYSDLSGGNTLLLPNRNLDYGYAKVDFGGSYQLFKRISVYAQTENLLSDQHIAPIGYVSLPFNFRVGLRLAVGKGTGTQ